MSTQIISKSANSSTSGVFEDLTPEVSLGVLLNYNFVLPRGVAQLSTDD